MRYVYFRDPYQQDEVHYGLVDKVNTDNTFDILVGHRLYKSVPASSILPSKPASSISVTDSVSIQEVSTSNPRKRSRREERDEKEGNSENTGSNIA